MPSFLNFTRATEGAAFGVVKGERGTAAAVGLGLGGFLPKLLDTAGALALGGRCNGRSVEGDGATIGKPRLVGGVLEVLAAAFVGGERGRERLVNHKRAPTTRRA